MKFPHSPVLKINKMAGTRTANATRIDQNQLDKDASGSNIDGNVMRMASNGSPRFENGTKQDTKQVSKNKNTRIYDPVENETLETPIGPDDYEVKRKVNKDS